MQLISHEILNNSDFPAGIGGIRHHSFLPIQLRSLIVPSFYLPIFCEALRFPVSRPVLKVAEAPTFAVTDACS